MTRQVRVPVHDLQPGACWLESEPARYLSRVHRLRENDEFIAFDPVSEREATGRILECSGRRLRCEIGDLTAATLVSPLQTTLLQGVGKGDKLDQVIRDATELGVRHVIAVVTERCTARPEEFAVMKRRRWEAVAVQAARQCGRGDVPRITGPLPLDAAIEHASVGWRLVLSGVASSALLDVLTGWTVADRIAVAVGPEGGFSPLEMDRLVTAGFQRAALGPFTLRTETAATAVLGTILAVSRLSKIDRAAGS